MITNPITKEKDGRVSWLPKEGDSYLVTAIDKYGKRLPSVKCATWAYANMLNVWKGRKYLVRDGKKYLIQEVNN